MMKPLQLLLPLLVLLCSCGGETASDRPVPRRHAYPRPMLYPREYVSAGGSPAIDINSSAAVRTDSVNSAGARWVTVDYPAYDGTIYMTFLPTTPSQFASAMDNRLERIGLNAGGGSMENLSFSSDDHGFSCELFTSRGETVSPVQFLAYDEGHTLLAYGTFNFNPGVDVAQTDSLAPIVNALRLDMLHLLKSLNRR
ncbi:MAG: hypothetical protein K2M07_00915 [Muribaculaceae bacterium]|nr:hypothetical protein [Muribaculaceae bacterium]